MSAVLQNISNSSHTKSKKKKAVKNLDAPHAASKDSSALPSPRNGAVQLEEAADAGEKEHIREISK
jgi:hypothetical protein